MAQQPISQPDVCVCASSVALTSGTRALHAFFFGLARSLSSPTSSNRSHRSATAVVHDDTSRRDAMEGGKGSEVARLHISLFSWVFIVCTTDDSAQITTLKRKPTRRTRELATWGSLPKADDGAPQGKKVGGCRKEGKQKARLCTPAWGSRGRDFLGKCVARASTVDHRQCPEP